jgi:hypothetical protein
MGRGGRFQLGANQEPMQSWSFGEFGLIKSDKKAQRRFASQM